jgi:uncharacterized membrane protein YedE/YeeE
LFFGRAGIDALVDRSDDDPEAHSISCGVHWRSLMYWNWKVGGAILGLTFFLAVALVKPIGVSTQFVIVDGIVADAVNPDLVQSDDRAKSGFRSTNAYLDKSGGKYAKAVANPVSYGLVFVVCMILGGLLGQLVTRNHPDHFWESRLPAVHLQRFGGGRALRYLLSFLGGIIVLLGARLAGGCTSGHMMSGIMQTSVSGYVFAVIAFLAAIPTAVLVYRR